MEKFKYNFAVFFSGIWPIGFFPFVAGAVSFLREWLGWWATKIYLEKNNKKDPSDVVIDAFSGQLITTSFASTSLLLNILAFYFLDFLIF